VRQEKRKVNLTSGNDREGKIHGKSGGEKRGRRGNLENGEEGGNSVRLGQFTLGKPKTTGREKGGKKGEENWGLLPFPSNRRRGERTSSQTSQQGKGSPGWGDGGMRKMTTWSFRLLLIHSAQISARSPEKRRKLEELELPLD